MLCYNIFLQYISPSCDISLQSYNITQYSYLVKMDSIIFSLKTYFEIYLAALALSCSMWNLSSSSQHAHSLVVACGIEPTRPSLGAWSLSQRTTREVPGLSIFDSFNCHCLFFYDTFDLVLEHLLFEINSLCFHFLCTFLHCKWYLRSHLV